MSRQSSKKRKRSVEDTIRSVRRGAAFDISRATHSLVTANLLTNLLRQVNKERGEHNKRYDGYTEYLKKRITIETEWAVNRLDSATCEDALSDHLRALDEQEEGLP